MTSAVILAGGKGQRFGGNKCFVSLNGRPVIDYVLSVIEPLVDEVIIVSPQPYKNYKTAEPGDTRGASVLNGVKIAKGNHVLIHEAVRPFITPQIVADCLLELENGAQSVDTAVPVVDGLLWKDNPISKEDWWISQTPEAFVRETLLECFSKANREYQDEVTMMADVLGIKPKVVMGVFINSKITFPHDLPNSEGILKFTQQPISTTPNLGGKKIVVYGSTGDIGKACVKQLLANGAVPIEMTRESLWHEPPVADGYIYAAGSYTDSIMSINFAVPLNILNTVKQGNIVFLSSTAATYGRGEALYSASKAALNSLIESMHEDLAKRGVFVNAIAPARVQGKLQAHFAPKKDQSGFLTPEEVADWCLRYLDTEAHGHIIYLRNKL